MALVQIKYEVRTPEQFAIDRASYYQQALEQISWADQQGDIDQVNFSEHHGAPDGYLPSPTVMMAAAAAKTKRMRLQSALVLPFYNPLRLAEDLAVVDIISGGRVEIAAIGGYVVPEFEMFGVALKDRGRRIEEAVAVLRQAWSGETFEYRGRSVRVTPRPLQEPGPRILMGGSAPVAARRAARIADGFMPMVPEAIPHYEAECERLGKQPYVTGKIEAVFVHISRDPDRDWQKIAVHAQDQSNMYVRWQSQTGVDGIFSPVSDVDALRSSGTFAVLTPEECLAMIERLGDQGVLSLDPLMGGMPAELGWESLELFASEVAPMLKAKRIADATA